MTLYATRLTSAYDPTDRTQAAGYATASITPAPNSLLVVNVAFSSTTDAGQPVVSGLSLTWNLVTFDLDGGRSMAVYTAQCGATPGFGTLTLTTTGGETALTGCAWWVVEWINHKVAAPIPQFKLTGGDGVAYTSSAGTLTNPIGHADNRVMMFTAIRLNSAITPRTNWVELAADLTGTGPAMAFHCSWRNDGTNETAFSSTFASARHQTIAIEIAAETVTWPYVEPFTYSDGELSTVASSRWIAGSGMLSGAALTGSINVASNQLQSPAGEYSLNAAVVALPTDDQYAKMLVRLDYDQEAFVLIRGSSDGRSGYAYWLWVEDFTDFKVGLYKITNGVLTALGSEDIIASGWNRTIEVRAVGNTISGYFNGTLMESVTDTTYPTQRGSSIMLHDYSMGSYAIADDYEAGTPIPTATGRPKVWTGSAFAQKPAKVWTGSAWIEKPVKVWTGSEWKVIT